MEGGSAPADQQGPQKMVVVDPMRNLHKFCGVKTESAGNLLRHLMIIWKYNK